MKEAIRLWNDLNFYIWCNQWKKANSICKELEAIRREKPFTYYVSKILSEVIIIRT